VDALTSILEGISGSDERPHVLLAHTVFGRGVSFMEGVIAWHYLPMSDEHYAMALSEVGGKP
jgi:transketolase